MPEFVYEAGTRFSYSAALAELLAYREVVWAFGARRLRTRYKQAVFGVGWAIVQPIAFLVVFSQFFDQQDRPGYAAGTYAALVGWQYVSSASTSGASSLVGESSLVRRVYFPREAPVLGSIGAFLPDLAVNLVILSMVVVPLGGEFGLNWIYAPLPVLLLVLAAAGFAIPLAGMAVYYRDFLYALPIGIQLWLLVSPTAYSAERVDPSVRWVYAFVNPLVGPFESLRNIFGSNEPPAWNLLGASTVSILLLLAGGYRLLKSIDRKLADVV